MRRNRLSVLDRIRHEIGTVVRIPSLRLVVISDAEIALRILEDTSNFSEKGLGLSDARHFLGSGRLTATTDEWLQTSRSTGTIYNGHAFRHAVNSIPSFLQQEFPKIDSALVPVRLQPLIDAAIMQSLLLPLIGARLSSIEPIQPLIDDINILANWTSRRLSIPSDMLSRLSWSISPGVRAALARIYARICAWREAPPEGTLASLATREPTEAHFETLTWLLAGFETTSATVAFAINATARSSLWAEALQTTDNALPVARAIIAETLRLHPPVWAITRRAKADVNVEGCRFRNGDNALIDVHGLQRDASIWAEPDQFEPSRFLSCSPHPDSYIPFGHGARQCIGRKLGADNSAAVVAWLFSNYIVVAPETPAEIHAGLAQHPAGAPAFRLARRR